MGSSVSHAAAPPPPTASPVGLAVALPPKDAEMEKKPEKVDYLNLPCPVPFEEIQREALSEILNPLSFVYYFCLF